MLGVLRRHCIPISDFFDLKHTRPKSVVHKANSKTAEQKIADFLIKITKPASPPALVQRKIYAYDSTDNLCNAGLLLSHAATISGSGPCH